jgi:hypothetical protein
VTGSGLDRPDESITWEAQAGRLASRALAAGDASGWFEQLYAAGASGRVPNGILAHGVSRFDFPSRPNVHIGPRRSQMSTAQETTTSCHALRRVDIRPGPELIGEVVDVLKDVGHDGSPRSSSSTGSVRPRGRGPRSSDGQGPHCRDRPGGRGVIDTAEPAHSSIS